MESSRQLNGQERRRYERQPVNIRAKINSTLLPVGDCEIRDFCEGGLSLAFTDPESLPTSLIQTKPTLSVSFSTDAQNKRETLVVKVKPVRLTSAGIGVTFVKPSARVLQTLRFIADTNPTQSCVAQSNHSLSAQFKSDIKASCEQAIHTSIPNILNEFFDELEPGLRAAAENAQSNPMSDGYLEALSTLTEQRTSFEQSFAKSFQQQPTPKSKSAATPADPATNPLSVVDKDEFEDWLALSDIINKTSSAHNNALSNIENKLGALLERRGKETNNPADPAVFCEALRDQLEDFELDHQVKQQIYRIFGNSLNRQLDTLYSALIEQLHPIEENNAGLVSNASNETASQSDIEPYRESKANDSTENKRPELVDTFKRFMQFAAAREPVSQNAEAGLTTVNRQTSPPTSISECTSSQILGTLRALIPRHDPILESYSNSKALESEILDRVKNRSSGEIPLSEDDQVYIDFAAKFCDVLNAQSTNLIINDSINEKLRLPLLNLAAHDSEFLNDPEHVSWKILDMVGRLNASLVEQDVPNGNEIRITLDQIIEEFSANSCNDVSILDSIRNKLEQIIKPLEAAKLKSIERIRENCAGKHQTEKAKAYVHSLIDERISGKSVPEILILLLDSGWEHLLTLSMLRHGAESRTLKRRLVVLDKLLRFFSEPGDLDTQNPGELQTLLNQIDEELAIVCSDFFQHRKIIDEMTAHLIGIGQPPVRAVPQMVMAEPRNTQSVSGPDTEIPEYLRDYADQVLELCVGDWLMFNTQGTEPQPVNLVWIGEDPWSFVFVNRKGQKFNELTLQSLTTFFKHKLVWKIESLDTPLSERTFSTMLQDMHQNLIQQSTVDNRTGLINRKEFDKQLKREYVRLKDDTSNHYLCNFEIEQIRWIDRTCGVDATESLIKTVIERITPILADQDIFARLGDQDFGIFFKLRSIEQLGRVCQSLHNAITGITFRWEEQSFKLGVSIGVTPFFKRPEGISGLLAHADGACSAAKNAGKNQIVIYGENSEELKLQESIYEWAGRITTILEQNRLFLRCQLIDPLFKSQTGHPHYEILLGIKDDSGNIVSPEVFIPAAEHSGRISEIDRWVVNQIFDWMDDHPEKMEAIEGFSINLSGHSVVSKEFMEFTKQLLTNRSVNPEKITFEITETAAISNLSRAQKFISQIKRYGCKFSLDDFGSGYSSYAYLKNLDVDYLKIDGVFVKDLAINDVDYAMVKSMNEIGHSLMIETVAEYVEDGAIIEKLREIGVDYAQGYGVQKPMLLTNL